MWSEALRMLDENSLKYYVDELREQVKVAEEKAEEEKTHDITLACIPSCRPGGNRAMPFVPGLPPRTVNPILPGTLRPCIPHPLYPGALSVRVQSLPFEKKKPLLFGLPAAQWE